MPEKTTKDGRTYRIDGRTFVWVTEDGAEVAIPLRMKLKVVRGLADQNLNDVAVMFDLLETVAPGQAEAMDEMDVVTDFEPMFTAWQEEYNALTGSTLGE